MPPLRQTGKEHPAPGSCALMQEVNKTGFVNTMVYGKQDVGTAYKKIRKGRGKGENVNLLTHVLPAFRLESRQNRGKKNLRGFGGR